MDENTTHEKIKKDRKALDLLWRHRRRMAYISLFSILIVTYWCLFTIPIVRIKVLSEIINWFYIIMGTIVSGYIGCATLDSKWKNDKKSDKEE